MKTFLILSILAFSGLTLSTRYEELKSLWESWKSLHGKEYSSLGEDTARYAIFLANYEKILEFNSQRTNVRLGLNIFADMTNEEFKQKQTGCALLEEDEEIVEANTIAFELMDYPDSVDWRTKGAVTPVKYQGVCGSCWTFSATGTLEGFYFINNGELLSFSEQQIVDCAKLSGFGCFGGWPYLALTYTANHGIEQESDYPYHAKRETCAYNSTKAIKVNSGYSFVTKSNVDAFKAAVATMPVSVLVESDQTVFQLYTSGIIGPNDGCGNDLDHAVLAVGYQPGAIIVKNSWGTNWGDQGYVMISDDGTANEGTGVCGILAQPLIPTK